MYRASWLLPVSFLCMAPLALAVKPELEARPCDRAADEVGARCGVVYVPEDHGKPRGRKIPLHVIVLPATGGQRETHHAQYDLEGGPGFAATDFLKFYANDGAQYRDKRDIVLADMRGTGQSNALRCAGIEERQDRQPTSPLYPPDLVAECARQLGVANDPRAYSTASAARDIELVRKALGYPQFDLNAISYGTTLALRYMAEYPESVRSAVLMGAVPANRTPPRYHASAAQVSLERLAADCAANPACRTEFGDVRANLAAALERVTGVSTMMPPVFLEKLRNQLYAPVTRAQVPYLLSRAARGDFSSFTKSSAHGRVFSDGVYLSITCAESFAQMDVEAAITAASATTFGSYRLERQRDACAQWPRSPADPKLMRQPTSKIPVLFIAGEQDPVSPADWAQETAAHFPRGLVVRVPYGAHVLDGLTGLVSCLDAVMLRFFDGGSVSGLDSSCFAQMMPPAFAASP
jgi:pimeloyl-ACP methyl ester carboxylesterase